MLETTFEQILTQLSKPAVRALTNEKIDSVDELYARGRKALLSLHGFGPKSIRTIEEMTGKELSKKDRRLEAILFIYVLFSSITTFIAVCFWLVRFCVTLFVSFGVTSLIGVTTCFGGLFFNSSCTCF